MNQVKQLGSPRPAQRHVRMEAWAKPKDISFSKHEPTVSTVPGEGPPFDPEKIPPDWVAAQLHAVRCR